jgi:glutathione S-transferase
MSVVLMSKRELNRLDVLARLAAGFDRDDVAAALEELNNTLERMEKALVSGPWLIGDELTLADIVVMPTIDRLADLGLSGDWPIRFPGVSDWYARLQRRPACRKTYSAGSRLSENMAIRPLAWT